MPLTSYHLHQLPPEVSDQIPAIGVAEKQRTVRQGEMLFILIERVGSAFPFATVAYEAYRCAELANAVPSEVLVATVIPVHRRSSRFGYIW
jgi:hypothetical protein